jgi:hypothetical protein
MNKRKYSYTEWGMLVGLFVGGGLATILSARTGNAFYYALAGMGLALGLGLGAAFDRSQHSTQEEQREPSKE